MMVWSERVEESARRRASRRRTLRAILAFASSASLAPAGAQQATRPGVSGPALKRAAELPPARDLAADAATARRDRVPIVLFFDRDNCPYCERALREYLVPMSLEGRWRTDAIFRQVEIDAPLPLVDFSGSRSTHPDVAARYRATLSPTVLAVDPAGEPLAPPVVGLATADFYAAYLEDALERAFRAMRAR